jgi:hypothetical protein
VSARPVDVVIPGAQRAGSTSLLRWLASHPALTSHERVTELPYFLGDHIHAQGWEVAFRRFYDDVPQDGLLLAKSVGILYSAEVTQRVLDHNPEVRFVVVVREPVSRAVSAFHYARQLGIEPLDDLAEAIRLGPGRFDDPNPRRACDYLGRSRYAAGIDRLRRAVGEDRVIVHRFEALTGDPAGVCRATFAFLGVDPDVEVDTSRAHNPSLAPRSRLLARVARPQDRPEGLTRRVLDLVPGRARDAVKRRLLAWNRRPSDEREVPVSDEARAMIREGTRDDVVALEGLLGWDLGAWRD